MANRLADESSPYLLQHADNPVDWYPWGEEALARAQAENKPIFVSIGYAACHWCHVMAHESFENDAVAAYLNEHFINVKVDREERPDVDAVYMSALQVMGQGGGWPLSAWCRPDGTPFYLGTYFPPEDKYGQPSFLKMLHAMVDVYENGQERVTENCESIMEALGKVDEHYRGLGEEASSGFVTAEDLTKAAAWLVERSDETHGGFGGAPKFPSSPAHDVLARSSRFDSGDATRDAYLRQCEAMIRGGIYDHVGGGFARYSVDEAWLVPHFEKMLYDNAQLLGTCGDAFALSGDERYVAVIRETVAWLEREMQHESGALYASLDADSEGEEGKFYVWTPAEIVETLGADDGLLFNEHFGVTPGGNFEDTRTTVLSRVTEPADEATERRLDTLRERLRDARDARVRPDTDTKVLTGWNALAVTGLIRAWRRTGVSEALALALRVGQFLADTMVHGDAGDRLWRVYKDGATKLDGTIDDYACCAEAFFDLAEATLDGAWWQRGRTLMGAVLERFYDSVDGVGVFYMTASDADEGLIHRPESHHDSAAPAGAHVAVDNLVRLALVCDDVRAAEVSDEYLRRRIPVVSPLSGGRLLAAFDRQLHGVELVVTDGPGKDELLRAAHRAYAPTLMVAGDWASEAIRAGKNEPGAAYVCRGRSCQAPTSDPDALGQLLTSV